MTLYAVEGLHIKVVLISLDSMIIVKTIQNINKTLFIYTS